jgi:hypothetical protein
MHSGSVAPAISPLGRQSFPYSGCGRVARCSTATQKVRSFGSIPLRAYDSPVSAKLVSGLGSPILRLPLILNRTERTVKPSLRLSKMMQSSRFGRRCLGNSTVANKPIDSLNGSGRVVGNTEVNPRQSRNRVLPQRSPQLILSLPICCRRPIILQICDTTRGNSTRPV